MTSKPAPTTMHAPLALTPSAGAVKTSATLVMNEAVAARRAAGMPTIHLGFGEARLPLYPPLREAMARALPHTNYAPVLGLPALRAAIAGYLERRWGLVSSPDTVLVGPGSKPLIYALLQVLEGDLLLPVPSWVSYAPQARLAGKRVVPVATAAADAFILTPAALDEALAHGRHAGANPRLLLVNTPSNPTGGMLAREDAAALAEWAQRTGVTLISDELYAELAHGWRAHTSPALFYPEGTIVTGGLSKAFSAGGWRLGYAALPPGAAGVRLAEAVRALASEVWSAAATPTQQAAISAFQPDPTLATYLRRAGQLHGHVAGRLHAALAARGIACPRPAGAFYLYTDFAPWRQRLAARGITTSEALARHVLDAWDMTTLPGTDFGEAPEALRLRLATSSLYVSDDLPPEEREPLLWDLLARTDALPAEDPAAGPPLPLPALDRAQSRLLEFVASLGAPSQ
ncbi:MAG: aminotransferase class I/II-fold pyridoxal phosphate-dependent enzyme [Ktedonobacterales bacterium]|nr:aminotransferase class I/II-fold pyridoxal phosphate-dependent enzyme [Ktedonobacterales bacterium]